MVYGIPNDRLGLTMNEFLTVRKTFHCSPRKLKNTGEKFLEKTKKNVNISGYTEKFFKPLKTRSSWVRARRFEYHKPYKFKKVGDNIFSDFSFFGLKFFPKKFSKDIKVMGNPSLLTELEVFD